MQLDDVKANRILKRCESINNDLTKFWDAAKDQDFGKDKNFRNSFFFLDHELRRATLMITWDIKKAQEARNAA
jgi:hypothetical protein